MNIRRLFVQGGIKPLVTVVAATETNAALVTVLAGAVVAALGYVGKLVVDGRNDLQAARLRRLTDLLRLQALLRASQTAFEVQCVLRDKLTKMLINRSEKCRMVLEEFGYDELFSQLYPEFTPDEAELHGIVRAYTQYALRPLNEELLRWLRSDTEYRAPRSRTGKQVQDLAVRLNQLDLHLQLWLAKYQAWIPDHPNHALCYASDEKNHGAAFPRGIDDVVSHVLEDQGIFVPRRSE